MITHYIPQWVLKRFGTPVYELNIHTGDVSPRTVRRAGSGDDLWPEDIERDLMGKPDNDAARVFRYWIDGKRRIVLPEEQQYKLAIWLALLWPRVPSASESMRKRIEDAKATPDFIRQVVVDGGRELQAMLQRNSPELYGQVIEVFGTHTCEAWILASVVNMVVKDPNRFLPNPLDAYHGHLRTASIGRFAEILCNLYHWTWLYSPRGFVIGDNPLVRWHEKRQSWNYGIKRANVEISMPVSAHLCLRLTQRWYQDRGHIMHCPRRQAIEYNRRQRLASINYVYSANPNLLREIAAVTIKPPHHRYRQSLANRTSRISS